MSKTLKYAVLTFTLYGALIGAAFYQLGERHGYSSGVASVAPLAGKR